MSKVLNIVWGDQTGQVFISTLDRSTKSWRDHCFDWPEDKQKIKKFIEEHLDYEVYWAPAVFSGNRRKAEAVKPVTCLWADLDTVPPSKCFIEPSIAWQSSPGRYQCIWLLDKPLVPKDAQELNKRMTYAVGADKSGWDLTQVLRVPGTTNHKYVEKPTVRLLWAKKLYYDPQDLADRLPPVHTNDMTIDPLDIETSDLREAVWPYRKVIGDRLWQLLFTPDSVVNEDDRSERLWELECRLLEAGVPVAEVLKIAKACPWNKFRGRPDEDKRLLTEVLKAEKHIKTAPIISVDTAVPWVSYAHFMGRSMVGPGWLVEGWWSNNSHGMLAGEPKTYKSVIATEIAVSVASGYPMWDKYKVIKPGPVLYVQEENPPWIVQDRMVKIAHSKGLLSGKVYRLKEDDELYVEFPLELPIRILNNYGIDLTLADHREILTKEIELVKPVLVILDPLYLMLGDTDENSAQELRNLLQWLLKVKEEYRTSIMVLHHWNKSGKSERGGQRMLGSTTLHAWVESAIYTSIRNVETNEITVEREFRSFMKPELLAITIRMSDPGAPPEYRVNIRSARESQMEGAQIGVLDYLVVHSTASANELAQIVGYSPRGIKKLMRKYEVEGLVTIRKGKKGKGSTEMYTITDKGRLYVGTKRAEAEAACGESS